MKFGIALGALHPAFFDDVVLEAERLGFESAWLPEHLVFPVDMSGSPFPGADHSPVPPDTPVFDAFAYLSYLAGRTSTIRLGTQVYLLGLRHPFVAARAITTLDLVSRGRAEVGIGAGWLRSEWRAAGLDPATRGRRLDEAIGVCKRLFGESVVEHRGEFFDFEQVMFEPKPVQQPHPPLLVGGESDAALQRAVRVGDGWLGLTHTPESAGEIIARLRRLLAAAGRERDAFEFVVGGSVEHPADTQRFEDAGVTRMIVSPWRRSPDAIESIRRFAERQLA